MLAKVQPFTPPSPDTIQTVSFTATFNPDPLKSNQFLLEMEGASWGGQKVLDEGVTEVQVSITLATEGASFLPQGAIAWTLPPTNETGYNLIGNTTLQFIVPAPIHVLVPLVFRFIANIPGANGVWSQSILLAKPASESPLTLNYDPGTGVFTILDSPGASAEDGVTLGDDLVMVNTQSGLVTLNLAGEPGIVFASTPIVWSSGIQPDWILPNPPIGGGDDDAFV